jgi:hypothetical protein
MLQKSSVVYLAIGETYDKSYGDYSSYSSRVAVCSRLYGPA